MTITIPVWPFGFGMLFWGVVLLVGFITDKNSVRPKDRKKVVGLSIAFLALGSIIMAATIVNYLNGTA